MAGPLSGLRIVEMAGIGPGPFCGMMLADHGSEVIRVERVGASVDPRDALARSRRSICIDLKSAEGKDVVRRLVQRADALIEGFRPGVMERLKLGPDELLAINPKLVYGRVTGWGQFGPYAHAAAHDINYIALSGVLHTCGRAGGPPTPPVNYLGDFAGGGMMLAFGVISAILHVQRGGVGQVIDCAMTDGSAVISAMTWSMFARGQWKDERGVNRLDTGAHYYDAYETSDGKWISIGSNEPQFYALLREKAQLTDPLFDEQTNKTKWPELKERVAATIRTRSRDEWCALMEGTDVCFAPVLSLAEAPRHPHNQARGTFVSVGAAIQPAPAPRYSSTATGEPRPAAQAGSDTDSVLAELGFGDAEVSRLRALGAVR
jgi:alpha-methylacyl-CoA racemase